MRPSAVYESSAFPSRDVEIKCLLNCNERIRSDVLDSHLLTFIDRGDSSNCYSSIVNEALVLV